MIRRFIGEWTVRVTILAVLLLSCNLSRATPVPSSGRTWFVSTSGNDSNDCRSAATACRTMRTAFERSSDGDAIRIAPGTYTETTRGSGSSFHIDKDVTLQGDDRETTIMQWDTDNRWRQYIFSVNADANVHIKNMTIIQSNPNGVAAVMANGALTLEEVNIQDSVVMGVFNNGGDVTIINSTISGNADYGIKNSYRKNLTVRGSLIASNDTSGLYNEGIAWIANSTFRNNQISGIVNLGDGQLLLSTSTLSGNEAYGVHNQNYAVLTNSTISMNGSGIMTTSPSANLILNLITIANNEGTGLTYVVGEFNVRNTLISNNGNQDCHLAVDRIVYAYEQLRVHNLDSDGSCSGSRRVGAEGDMYLGPLADNGGTTQTHALLEGHPAIDSARDCGIDTDQRGIGRPTGGGCDIGSYEYSFAIRAVSETITPGVIPLITDTLAPTTTPLPTETLQPATVTATKNTNCRYGPGVVYDIADTLFSAQSAPVIGRNQEANWFQIEGPITKSKCWVSLASVEAKGALPDVPVVAAPPTPVPTAEEAKGCYVYNQQKQAVCVVPCPKNAQPGGACKP